MTNTNSGKLYYQSLDDLKTLPEAITHFQNNLKDNLKVANALVYSPKYCKLLKLEDSQIYDSKNNSISLVYEDENIFEARIFTEKYELRWLQEENGKGKAVFISEEKFTENPEEVLDTIDQQYLLWGKQVRTELQNGWQRLSTARIGAINVFVNENNQQMNDKQRVYLHTREYLKIVDNYGNVGVFEERLIKLDIQ